MKASTLEVASDGITLTEHGPRLAEQIEKGDKLVVVERGREELARVSAIEDGAEDVECVRMLTPIGDIVVPVGARVMTREGPRTAGDVLATVRDGKSVRAETIAPPAQVKAVTSAASLVEEALLSLLDPPHAVCIPVAARGVIDSIRSSYKRLGVTLSVHQDGRWLALTRDDGQNARGRGALPGSMDLMSALAWEVNEDGAVEARLTLQASRVRRLLIASLIAEDRPFVIKWTPAYRPVEARLQLTDAWPAFVKVDSAEHQMAPTRRVTVACERPTLALGLSLVS